MYLFVCVFPLAEIDFHIAHIGSCISIFHVGQQMSK